MIVQGRKMNMVLEQKLKIATSGLTGLRERDILYLRGQMQAFAGDAAVTARLANILSAICIPEFAEEAD